MVQYNQGQVEEARQSWESAREIFHWTGHRSREATLLNNLGAIAFDNEQYATSQRMRYQAMAIYEEAGDKSGQAVTLTNLGLIAMTLGQPAEAQKHFDLALKYTTETNDRYVQSLLHADRCHFFSVYGAIDQAIAEGEAALSMVREIEAGYIEGVALPRLARAYMEGKRLDEAEQYYLKGLEVLRSADVEPNLVVELRVGLAAVALERGDLPGAVRRIDGIFETLIREDLRKADEVFWVYRVAHEILKTAGDPRASAVLKRGQAVLNERAGHIENPEYHRSFLENIPSNKYLLSMRDES